MTSFLTEPRYGIRYPAPGAALPDYEAYLQALADDVGTKTAGYSSGLLSARPAAGTEGRTYRTTDTGLWYFDNGSAWQTAVLQGSGAGPFVPSNPGGSTTASAGQQVLAPAGSTITLPAAFVGAVVRIVAGAGASGASPVTVTRSGSNLIDGVGMIVVTSFVLGTPLASVDLESYDGTTWIVTAGQRDTGWIACGLGSGFSLAAGWIQPAYRVIGDRAYLTGACENGLGSTISGPAAVLTGLPASPVQAQMSASQSNATPTPINLSTGGTTAFLIGSVFPGIVVAFEGVSYRLT